MKRLFIHLLALVQVLVAVMVPANNAVAAVPHSTWGSFAADSANWMRFNMPDGVSTVDVPRLGWRPLANMGPSSAGASAAVQIEMLSGERWVTLGREQIGALGLSAQDVSDIYADWPSNAPYVFGLYSPATAQLRIFAVKVERRPDGVISTSIADYTPWHGLRAAARRHYLDATEKAAGGPGHNTFGLHTGSSVTDPLFQRCDSACVTVAMGHAMMETGGVVGFLAYTETRPEIKTKSWTAGLKKKTKTTVKGFSKPRWMIALPIDSQGRYALTATKCVLPAVAGGCQKPEHVAFAGISLRPWDGGNMPADETQTSHWSKTKSSWNVMGISLILAIVTMGVLAAASAIAGAAGASVGATAGTVGAGAAGGAATATLSSSFGAYLAGMSTTTMVGISAGVAAFHAVSSIAMLGGSLTSAQSGVYGATTDGVTIPNLGTGVELGMNVGARDATLTNSPDTSLDGTRLMYSGTCGPGSTVAACNTAGRSPGFVHRPDSFSQVNTTRVYKARMAECSTLGYTGVAQHQCAGIKRN